jgi:uncharacterized membrane protein YgcG
MDEDFVERRPGDMEMYRRLDAFAQVRLAPDAAAMARIRAALMGQAIAMADARAASMALPMQAPAVLPKRPSMSLPRAHVSRWSAAFLAACLTLGVVAGSVAASAAGGPFYGPRLWLEEATLPSAPLAHARGQLDRLDARLEEVRIATTSGNIGAIEAALMAYAEIVEDLEAQALVNPAVAADVLDEIARRQVVLMALLGDVPPQAQDALQHALQQGANAVEAIGDDSNPGDPVRRGWGGPGTNPGGGQGSGAGGTGDGGGGTGDGDGGTGDGDGGSADGESGDQGETGDGPGKTNKPDDTPAPAEPAPKPERTPKPRPTPREPQEAPTPQPPSNPSGEGEQSGAGGGSSRQSQGGDDQGDAD